MFCGCGGLDLGFERAGYRCLGGYDIDPLAVQVHNSNLKGKAFVCDLRLPGSSLRREFVPDVVIAGSPCQGFSTLGKGRVLDPRNSLYIQAARLAISLKPEVIVLENVTGLLAPGFAKYVAAVELALKRSGYYPQLFKLVCSDFGIPQIRKRVLMVAAKRKTWQLNLRVPGATSLRESLRNVEGLANHQPRNLIPATDDFRIANRINQHQKLCNVRRGPRAVPTWLIPEVFGETTKEERIVLETIQRLRRQIRLRNFGDADPLKVEDIVRHCGSQSKVLVGRLCKKGFLKTVRERFDLAHTFNGKFRRLSWQHPTPAVDTRFGDPRYYLHPEQNRGISVREAARIQGFPDDFVFDGHPAAQYRLVGNAVPPPVANTLARAIRAQLL